MLCSRSPNVSPQVTKALCLAFGPKKSLNTDGVAHLPLPKDSPADLVTEAESSAEQITPSSDLPGPSGSRGVKAKVHEELISTVNADLVGLYKRKHSGILTRSRESKLNLKPVFVKKKLTHKVDCCIIVILNRITADTSMPIEEHHEP